MSDPVSEIKNDVAVLTDGVLDKRDPVALANLLINVGKLITLILIAMGLMAQVPSAEPSSDSDASVETDSE